MSGLTFPVPRGATGARGYSHLAVATGPGQTVYIAGTFGMKDGRFAGGPGDFRAQCEQAFENVKNALATGGATFKDVARITNYFVDMAHLPIFFEVRDRYVNTKAPPASTAFQVVKLARDEALFEIEAIAFVAPKKTATKKKAAKKRR